MTCSLCSQPIAPGAEVNYHHPVYRSEGGTHTEPAHKACHVELHSKRGDFQAWGQIGGKITATTRRWAFNLKNVSTDPAHDLNRAFYTANYSRN
jgi:hypothetical protein